MRGKIESFFDVFKKIIVITPFSDSFFEYISKHFPFLYKESKSERIIEYAWILENLNLKPKSSILDVGCSGSLFSIMLASLGYKVIGIDLEEYWWNHPNFRFYKCDIITPPPELTKEKFDAAIVISTLEHVGVFPQEDPDGDLKAIKAMKTLIKAGGSILLSIPYGKTPFPHERIYDDKRLEMICGCGLRLVHKNFFIKKGEYWMPTTKNYIKASQLPATSKNIILCIKLRKEDS